MLPTWSGWKRFPDDESGGRIDAPAGPGVYEVRHSLTGRVVAFGSAGDVARALSEFRLNGGSGLFARLFRQPLPARIADLEYRTCATTSRAEARSAAQRLMGLRQNAWRRRVEVRLTG